MNKTAIALFIFVVIIFISYLIFVKINMNKLPKKGDNLLVYESAVLRVGQHIITTRGISGIPDYKNADDLSIKVKLDKKEIHRLSIGDTLSLDELTLKLVELIPGENEQKGKIIFEVL